MTTPSFVASASTPGNPSLSAPLGALPENGPVLDYAVISRLKSFDPEGKRGLVRRLASIYLESAPGILAEIRRCHDTLAKQDLRYQAHKFKTSNANLGLHRMHALLEELEMSLLADPAAESGGSPCSEDLIALIESEGVRAIEAVRSL